MHDEADRLHFPEDELRHHWLPILLDLYAVADTGVREAIRREERQGRKLACTRGCAECCRAHLTIPVYPLELIGIYWFVAEKLTGAPRAELRGRLAAHRPGEPCPFLVEEACVIHPLRPLACRHFNVFGRRCAPGEDAFYSRRRDVMTPIKRYTDEAFSHMLLFHGLNHKAERRKAVEKGAQHALVKVFQECRWENLVSRMDAIEPAPPRE